MKNTVAKTIIQKYVVAYYGLNNCGQYEICYMSKYNDTWGETMDVLFADSCSNKEQAEQIIEEIEKFGIHNDWHILKVEFSINIEECQLIKGQFNGQKSLSFFY